MVDTLLIDQERVYTPRQSNDRLLLGLKGSLNEYELDLLRQRSVEARREKARREKARRGELIVASPAGYVKSEEQRLEKDPDRRVQEGVMLVFRKFLELGSARQTLMWFLEHSLQVPVSAPCGRVIWRRPRYTTIYNILSNPVYAGAYAYGKTEHTTQYDHGQSRRRTRRKPRDQWWALIPDTHEGYISWKQYQEIQQTMTSNAHLAGQSGAARRGLALAGLLRCRRCGRKLMVGYTGNGPFVLRYGCNRGLLDNGDKPCISFAGPGLDEAIAKEILGVVEPAAVEAAVLASTHEGLQQDQVLEALHRDLEAAKYAAHRASRQYELADPENRLVADELERRWNQALQKVQEVELRIQQKAQRKNIAPATREEFENLAGELEAVWKHPDSDARLKKKNCAHPD